MDKMWLPLVLGLLSVGIVICFIVYSYRERLTQRAEEAAESGIQVDPLEISRLQTVAARQKIRARFKQKYDAVTQFMHIPADVGLVVKESSVFSLRGVHVQHYCWATEHNLYIFPQWESIDACLDNPSCATQYEQGDENNLYTLTIPIDRIECFAREDGLPGKQGGSFVVLRYDNHMGEAVTTTFSEGAHAVFKALLPYKEQSYIFAKVYPKSAQNIRDIKDKMTALKELWQEELITQEEYAEKKKQILITM